MVVASKTLWLAHTWQCVWPFKDDLPHHGALMLDLANVQVSGGVQHTGGSSTDRLCAEEWLET